MCTVLFAALNALFSFGDHQIVRMSVPVEDFSHQNLQEPDVMSNNLVCTTKCVQSLVVGVLFGKQWSKRLIDARIQCGCDAVDNRFVLFVGHFFLRLENQPFAPAWLSFTNYQSSELLYVGGAHEQRRPASMPGIPLSLKN